MTKGPIIISVCLCLFCFGCNDQNPTPDNYKNSTIVDRVQYEHNRAEIKDSIEMLIEGKEGPFYPKENDSLTAVIVDTILYSPNKDKYASFIITKNSNDKLLDKGNKSD